MWPGLFMSHYLGLLPGIQDMVRTSLPPMKDRAITPAAEPFSSFDSVSPVFNTLEQYGPHLVLGQKGCPGVTPLSSFHPRTYLTPG